MFATFAELHKYVKAEAVETINLKVSDLNGMIRQVSIPSARINQGLFEEGMGLGMSSYPGYRTVEASDMLAVPDMGAAFWEPWSGGKVLTFLCNIYNPDGSRFERDPRYIAGKAEAYVKEVTGAKEFRFSPELEFYIFDDVRYTVGTNQSFYAVDSVEASWNTGREEKPNLGYKIPRFEGQHYSPPRDHLFAIRQDIVRFLESVGIEVKYHHHEAGGPGQSEIEFNFTSLTKAADNVQIAKYAVKNIVMAHGKSATFMPKPLFDEAGNGMHVHLYPTDGNQSLFYDAGGYAGLNEMAFRFIGGLFEHTPALMAITNPSTNSYRRFSRGLAAPYNLFFSAGNRSAALRIPSYAIGAREERIEYRIPDGISNPYLCLGALAMAGADGIKRGISPQREGYGPFDVNVYTLPEKELAQMKKAPATFEEALEALSRDYSFLTEGGVFDSAFVQTWTDMKWKNEIQQLSMRTHPYEFQLYYDR